MECLSLGISQRKDLIVKCLVDLFHPKGIFEKSEAQVLKKEGVPETQGVLYGEVPERIVISENGVKMYVDVRNGQKTGYFLDQKENRMAIRRYAKDKTVLDCFSNSGGFSINAATVAKEVTAVDISEIQVKAVLENATLNGFKNVNAVCADVFEYLRLKKRENKKYGVVVLDPPAFTKSRKTVGSAQRGYKEINLRALKLLPRGGYFATASCSHFMPSELFVKMLKSAAADAGVELRQIEARQQAPDHPILWNVPETDYLKFYIFQVV